MFLLEQQGPLPTIQSDKFRSRSLVQQVNELHLNEPIDSHELSGPFLGFQVECAVGR